MWTDSDGRGYAAWRAVGDTYRYYFTTRCVYGARHNEGVNVCMFDGHAKWFKTGAYRGTDFTYGELDKAGHWAYNATP